MKPTEIVGRADNAAHGRKSWTRLSVYYQPDPRTGKAFVAEVVGFHNDQQTHQQTLHVGSLDIALDFFKASALSRDLKLQCEDWWERNEDRHQKVMASEPVGIVATRLSHVIGWLYQGQHGDLVPAFAKDFGFSEDVVRMTVKIEDLNGQADIIQPFLKAMQWFDREAWLAAKGR